LRRREHEAVIGRGGVARLQHDNRFAASAGSGTQPARRSHSGANGSTHDVKVVVALAREGKRQVAIDTDSTRTNARSRRRWRASCTLPMDKPNTAGAKPWSSHRMHGSSKCWGSDNSASGVSTKFAPSSSSSVRCCTSVGWQACWHEGRKKKPREPINKRLALTRSSNQFNPRPTPAVLAKKRCSAMWGGAEVGLPL
jgi:hypothetical protein